MLDWYNFYLNHKIYKQFKTIKTLYIRLPPKKISELKPWDKEDVDLLVTYSKYIRQQKPGGAIIKNNMILACMTIINPTEGWFEIFEMPTYDLYAVMGGNGEYIDK